MAKSTEIIEKLDLQAHPEGGFFSESFRDTSLILSKSLLSSQYKVDRPVSTAIYFLLPSGSVSHLHRIPCAETWHFYLGEPITVLELNEEKNEVKLTCIGSDLIGENQHPQYTVAPNIWFGAFPTKDYIIDSNGSVEKAAPRDFESHYSLVGCTRAPAFQFEDFELAKRADLISRFPKTQQWERLPSNTDEWCQITLPEIEKRERGESECNHDKREPSEQPISSFLLQLSKVEDNL